MPSIFTACALRAAGVGVVLSALTLPAPAQDAAGPFLGDGPHLVEVLIDGPSALRAIADLGLDVPCGQPRLGPEGPHRAAVLASAEDLQRLDARGISWEMRQVDLDDFYRSRLEVPQTYALGSGPTYGSALNPVFGQGGMGGFYTYAEVVSVLDQLSAAYPDLVSPKQSIGTTIEGRDIWAVKISDNPGVDENEPEVRFDAIHHAREPQGMQTLIWFMSFLLEDYGSDPLATYLVDEREIWCIPVVNPDGYEYNRSIEPNGGGLWRKNRRNNGDGTIGVDLNRNYPFEWGYDNIGSSPFTGDVTYRGPSPASEPETMAMTAFISSRLFRTALSIHTFSNLWLGPYGYDLVTPPDSAALDEIADLAVEVNGYAAGQGPVVLYAANGGTFDYDYGTHGVFSWTPEIGGQNDGFWPPSVRIVPLAEENLLGFQRTALAGGAWVRASDVTRLEIGNGNGAFEAGESVDFDVVLRNSGRDAASSATVSLSSASPFASIATPSANVGALAPFTSSLPQTVSLGIAPGTPSGTLIDYTLSIVYDGFVQETAGKLVTGTPRVLIVDDLEVDVGWTVGLPSDTAATGLWERADPIGTDSGGVPAAPGVDATPGPSTFAYVTGNGGGSAGNDDVDDGLTTLITPRFDLAGAGVATVGYTRWYADLSTADDVFDVSISNDDGANWTSLEVVTSTENSWTQVEFVVPEVIAQTDAMRLRFIARDDPNNSVYEAGIDDLTISIYGDRPHTLIWGTPEIDTDIAFTLVGEPGAAYTWYLSPATVNLQIGSVDGPLLIDPSLLITFLAGTVPASGQVRFDTTLPNDPLLIGLTAYFQALTVDGGDKALSNRTELTVE